MSKLSPCKNLAMFGSFSSSTFAWVIATLFPCGTHWSYWNLVWGIETYCEAFCGNKIEWNASLSLPSFLSKWQWDAHHVRFYLFASDTTKQKHNQWIQQYQVWLSYYPNNYGIQISTRLVYPILDLLRTTLALKWRKFDFDSSKSSSPSLIPLGRLWALLLDSNSPSSSSSLWLFMSCTCGWG